MIATVTCDCDSEKFCNERKPIKSQCWFPEPATLSICYSADNKSNFRLSHGFASIFFGLKTGQRISALPHIASNLKNIYDCASWLGRDLRITQRESFITPIRESEPCFYIFKSSLRNRFAFQHPADPGRGLRSRFQM